MRENSGLWIALLVVGGLLLAGLAGVGAMLAVKTRTAQQRNVIDREQADAERARAEAERLVAQKPKGTAPTAKAAEPQAEPTATEKWARADVREYAKKLLKDYQGNAVAADNKYKDRTVGVVGEVQKVDTLKGKPVVILKGAAVEFDVVLEHVLCVCDNADRDKLAELAEGHWVALVGRCTGKESSGIDLGSTVMLQGCSVVHVARTEAEMKQAFAQQK